MGHKPRMGRPPKLVGAYRNFALRLPESVYEALKRRSEKDPDRSMNDLLVEAAQQWLARRSTGRPSR